MQCPHARRRASGPPSAMRHVWVISGSRPELQKRRSRFGDGHDRRRATQNARSARLARLGQEAESRSTLQTTPLPARRDERAPPKQVTLSTTSLVLVSLALASPGSEDRIIASAMSTVLHSVPNCARKCNRYSLTQMGGRRPSCRPFSRRPMLTERPRAASGTCAPGTPRVERRHGSPQVVCRARPEHRSRIMGRSLTLSWAQS